MESDLLSYNFGMAHARYLVKNKTFKIFQFTKGLREILEFDCTPCNAKNISFHVSGVLHKHKFLAHQLVLAKDKSKLTTILSNYKDSYFIGVSVAYHLRVEGHKIDIEKYLKTIKDYLSGKHEDPQITINAGQQEVNKRRIVALLIGNNYSTSDCLNTLHNCINDARELAQLLQSFGIEVRTIYDGTKIEIENAVEQLIQEDSKHDHVIFFFSGHGSQFHSDYLFLYPVDYVHVPENFVEHVNSLRGYIDRLSKTKYKSKLFFIDACRCELETKGFPASTKGPIECVKGTFIAYATRSGEIACDRINFGDKHSPYMTALLKNLAIPNLNIYDLFQNVARDMESMGCSQGPWQEGNLTGNFIINSR